jgi:FkbM family methyltransferase
VPCAKFIQGFGKTNRIYAFEPGIAADLLQANLDLNRVSDLVTPDFRAVSDRCGPVAMNSMLGHSVCDSINDFRKHYPHLVHALTRIVNAVTVDEFVREKNISETLILKIDAEGHDYQVLQGTMQSFERGQVGVAMIEFVPHYLKQFIDPTQLLVDLARDHHLLYILELKKGYHWKGTILPEDASALRDFTQKVAKSPLTWTDIVAVAKRLPESGKLAQLLCDD